MKVWRKTAPSLFLAISISLFVVSRMAIGSARETLGVQYVVPARLLPTPILKTLCGEFKGVVADYLLLEIAAFIGSNKEISREEWQKTATAFEQVLALDPYFQQTYIYIQGNLPWDGEMPEKAIELLETARVHRNWDWRPGYYMGFDYYYFLKDYLKASELFFKTAEVKGAPVIVPILGARFAAKSDRTQAGIELLESMLNDQGLDENSQKEISNRLAALRGVALLENAVNEFQTQYMRPPESLQELVQKEVIPRIPDNPYGNQYSFSKETGRVLFDEIK